MIPCEDVVQQSGLAGPQEPCDHLHASIHPMRYTFMTDPFKLIRTPESRSLHVCAKALTVTGMRLSVVFGSCAIAWTLSRLADTRLGTVIRCATVPAAALCIWLPEGQAVDLGPWQARADTARRARSVPLPARPWVRLPVSCIVTKWGPGWGTR